MIGYPHIVENDRINSTYERLRREAAKRANACLFADADEPERRLLPVVAARESAKRRDTVRFPRLAKGERGAFLVEFEWLREELAR